MLPDSPEKRVHLTKLLRGRNSSTKGFYVIVQPKLAPLLTPQRVNGFIYQIGFYRLYSFKKKTTPYCPMLVLITRPKFSEDSSCENTPCKRSILAKSLIFIQDCFSYAFYFWPSLPRTKKQKKRLISDYPSRFDFIQAGQTLEISFPFPPLIFLLSLA